MNIEIGSNLYSLASTILPPIGSAVVAYIIGHKSGCRHERKKTK